MTENVVVDNSIISEWSYPNGERLEIQKLRIMTFGVLADIAFPVVEHYRSDMYHDVLWINEHVNGPIEFFYSVNGWGTNIGDSEEYVASREIGYHVVVTAEVLEWNTRWKVVATPIGTHSYTAEEETAEILADPDTMAALAEAENE